MIHAFEKNDPAAIVDDRDNAAPVVALRLGLGAATILRAAPRVGAPLLQELRLHARPQENHHSEDRLQATAFRIAIPSLMFDPGPESNPSQQRSTRHPHEGGGPEPAPGLNRGKRCGTGSCPGASLATVENRRNPGAAFAGMANKRSRMHESLFSGLTRRIIALPPARRRHRRRRTPRRGASHPASVASQWCASAR